MDELNMRVVDEAAQVREHLARAGILEAAAAPAGPRPGAGGLARAARRAGQGTPLDRLVSGGRD